MQILPAVYAVDGGKRCLRALYPLISVDAPTTWIHVAMEGSWEGHPSGPFAFDAQTFAQIVANFESNPNPVPLDYEHATEYALPAPACGWVQGLEVRHDESGANLYALVELTDEAASFIRTGEYRFSSGVFDFDSIDPRTGKSVGCEMTSLALTNLPFLRGQRPIKLSRRTAPTGARMSAVNKADLISHLRKLNAEEITPEMAQQLATALGMLGQVMGGETEALKSEEPEAAAPSSGLEEKEDEKDKPMSAALSAEPAPAPVAAAEPPPAEVPAPDAGALLEQVMQATGLDLAALVEALKGLVGGTPMPSAAPAPLSAKVQEHQIAALTRRATKAEAELAVYRTKEAHEAVDVLVCSGRLLDNARADFERLYLSDRASFERMVAGMPAIVPMGEHATKLKPPTETTPAIDEADPEVQRWRRNLSQTRLSAKQRDQYIRDRLAERARN